MNKRERAAAAAMVAEWEWTQTGSSSEAAAMASCACDVIRELKLPEDDLLFARTFEIFRQMGDVENDELFDALDTMVERLGYDAVVDKIEATGFDGFRAALAQKEAER